MPRGTHPCRTTGLRNSLAPMLHEHHPKTAYPPKPTAIACHYSCESRGTIQAFQPCVEIPQNMVFGFAARPCASGRRRGRCDRGGSVVADYVVTPADAGFGTEKPSLAAGGEPKSRSEVRSVAPADANRWPADRHDRCARPWLRHSRDTQSGETAAVRPPWHHLAAPRHTSPAGCRSA